MRTLARWRLLIIAAVLSGTPSRALAYRPFVSTDAAVAGPGEVEIDFGYAGFRRNDEHERGRRRLREVDRPGRSAPGTWLRAVAGRRASLARALRRQRAFLPAARSSLLTSAPSRPTASALAGAHVRKVDLAARQQATCLLHRLEERTY